MTDYPGAEGYGGLFRGANAIGAGLLLYYLSEPVSMWILLRLISIGILPAPGEMAAAVLGAALSVLSFSAALCFILRLTPIPARIAFPLGRPPVSLTVACVGCGMGSTVIGIFLSAVVNSFFKEVAGVTPTMPEIVPQSPDPAVVAVRIFTIAVIPAIYEELVFRGAILQALRRYGESFAIIVSALLFAMAHRNMVQGPNAFLLGLVMGFFVVRSGSLIPAMLFHFINNFSAGMLGVYLSGIDPERGAQINFGYLIICLAMGIAGAGIMWFYPGKAASGLYNGNLSAIKRGAMFFLAPAIIVYILMTVTATLSWFA